MEGSWGVARTGKGGRSAKTPPKLGKPSIPLLSSLLPQERAPYCPGLRSIESFPCSPTWTEQRCLSLPSEPHSGTLWFS